MYTRDEILGHYYLMGFWTNERRSKMIVFRSIIETLLFITTTTTIIIILNYIFVKEFKTLANKIKRVIFSNDEIDKITQIKKLVYEYLFID